MGDTIDDGNVSPNSPVPLNAFSGMRPGFALSAQLNSASPERFKELERRSARCYRPGPT